jgi:hypothetical protein
MRLIVAIVLVSTLYPMGECHAQNSTEFSRFFVAAINACLSRKDDDPRTSSFPMPVYQAYCLCFADAMAHHIPAIEKDDPTVTGAIIRTEDRRCYETIKADALKGQPPQSSLRDY